MAENGANIPKTSQLICGPFSRRVSSVPVIALTNLTEEAEKQRALKLGVKAYLVKAMQTPEEVVQKVKVSMAS